MHDVTPNAVAIAERATTTTLMMVLHNIFLESSIMLIFSEGLDNLTVSRVLQILCACYRQTGSLYCQNALCVS